MSLAPRELDSLRRLADSLQRALVGEIRRRTLHIGGPSLVAFMPDSAGQEPEFAELRREFAAGLPRAARVASAYQFRFYVRPSAGLQLRGPRDTPIWGAQTDPQQVGYLLAAPGYPVVRLRGICSDSALADALARYATLIGLPRAIQRRS